MSEEKFDQEGFDRLKKQYEDYQVKLREKMGKFSIDNVLKSAKEIRSVFVEGLGEVKFVLLTEVELTEIAKKYPDDIVEREQVALCKSLAAVDSEVTLEKIKALPADVNFVLRKTVLSEGFLPRKTLNGGSPTPANFKA